MTPTCLLAGLTVSPSDGWINVPFEDPPDGHLGCQMLGTNAREEVVGIIRVRSAANPAKAFASDGFDELMAIEVGTSSKWAWSSPTNRCTCATASIASAGFREGRGLGIPARIDGNPIEQEAHFLMFRSDTANYVFTLLTPVKSHDAQIYQRNNQAFRSVLNTLQPRQ